MLTTTTPRTGRSRPSTITALTMLGLTAAFGWVVLLDLRLYGEVPDPSILPIQALLVATTLLAASRWRWAPAVAAVVALGVGVGSAVQPITTVRLTAPETLGMQVATVLILVFAAATAASGAAATARTVRTRRSRDRAG